MFTCCCDSALDPYLLQKAGRACDPQYFQWHPNRGTILAQLLPEESQQNRANRIGTPVTQNKFRNSIWATGVPQLCLRN